MSELTTRDLTFRGNPYKIRCRETSPQFPDRHPSWFSFEDEADVRDLFWHIEPGDVVLDLGAAYGSYTLTALASGAAHVYAWSPEGPKGEETEAHMLTASLAENGWTERTTLYRHGLYSDFGYLDPLTQEFHPAPADASPACPRGTIFVGPLDAVELDWASEGNTWIKLDVEGAEIEVLNGGARVIAERRPKILVESHNFKRETLEQEVRDWMKSHGYREVGTRPYHSVSHSFYVPG